MKRILLALGTGFAVFAGVALAAGRSGSDDGQLSGDNSVACDTDGVFVTYQDPNDDGNYERATVSDIDCFGKHTTTVRILDDEPVANTILAAGKRKTSGSVSVVTLTNVLLESEIEDADRVRVIIVQTH